MGRKRALLSRLLIRAMYRQPRGRMTGKSTRSQEYQSIGSIAPKAAVRVDGGTLRASTYWARQSTG